MRDEALIERIQLFKRKHNYTLYDLSKIFDMQVATIERWFKTKRINVFYAKLVKEKLRFIEK
jgi:hypothetical protein